MENQWINHFLPEELLAHFDLAYICEACEIKTRKIFYLISLVEKNIVPEPYPSSDYESKGFYESKTIQDFPIRGKAVYLCIARRRWRHKERKNESINNDYSFVAEGSKLTQELSDFLKGAPGDQRRND